MTNRVIQQARFQWGSVGFNGYELPLDYQQQNVQRLATGAEVQRAGRAGVYPFRIDDLSGGFFTGTNIASAERDRNKFYFNQGINTHIPGLACLPYITTMQTSIASVNASGYKAANKRAHCILTSLGTTGLRFYSFLDTNMYRDTSLTNPALTVPTTDNVTDIVTATAHLRLGSTDYLAIAGNTTDDIRGTTDPTAAAITWTELATLSNAADYIDAMHYFPTLGPGVNVFVGNVGNVNGWWFAKQAATIPATLSPIVTTDTKDTENQTNTVLNTGWVSPAVAFEVRFLGTTEVTTAAGTGLTVQNINNILASDNARAGNSSNGSATFFTGYLCASQFGLQIPAGAAIVGVEVGIERSEADAATNAIFHDVALFKGTTSSWGTLGGTAQRVVGITVISTNKSTSTEFPLTASEDYETFGSSTDLWGTEITRAMAIAEDFGVAFRVRWVSNLLTDEFAIDHVRIRISYQPGGTQAVTPNGGFTIGPQPANPHRLTLVLPQRTDKTAVTVPRELWFGDLTWDAAGDRPTVTLSRPHTGLGYVEDVENFQGGIAVAGGGSSLDFGVQVKIVDATGNTRDLGFPAIHGTTAVRGRALLARGTVLFYWVVGASDTQLWMYWNGRWLVYGSLFSLIAGIISQSDPIAFAERSFNLQQNQLYIMLPNSTTALAAFRQFVPPDIFSDPHRVNTTEAKQSGVYVQLPEADVLPEEANKALLAVQVQTRLISVSGASGTYGSVQVQVDTGGDTAIGTAEYDNTFTAGLTDDNLEASGDPGISYRTMLARLTLVQGTSGSVTYRTPNALPLLFSIAAQWPHLERFQVVLTSNQQENVVSLSNRLRTLASTKVVQRLRGAGYDIPAILETFNVRYKSSLGTQAPTWNDVQSAILIFRRVTGATS